MTWESEDIEQQAEEAAAAIDAVSSQPVVTSSGPSSVQFAPSLQQQYQIVTEAQRRLAKAQLYQALLDQSVFGQSSVNPEIVEEVSNELRTFALERLEIMLGMRVPAGAHLDVEVSLTPEEVGQVRDLLRQAVAGNVPILGTEESTALRLLLAKITGRAPSLPAKLAPVVRPVQVQAATPVNAVVTPVSSQTQPTASPTPQPAPRPGPGRPRRKVANNPNKIPMPSIDAMNAKAATDAASASATLGGSPAASILNIAVQTAINEAKDKPE